MAAMTAMTGKETEVLTPEGIEIFVNTLQKQETRDSYRRTLENLYAFLPEKRLSSAAWEAWKKELQSQGLCAKTVNHRLSVYNSYLRFIGRKDWCGDTFLTAEKKIQPELTRNEYRRLLSAAKQLEKEKVYLLIKAIGGFGIALRDLPLLTVEAVEDGEIHRLKERPVRLSKEAQAEFRAYARQKGFKTGPVFQTAAGQPIDRTSIYHLIGSVSAAALVEPEKVTPRCLWNMYCRTRKEIEEHMAILAEQSYRRLLEDEQRTLGWEDYLENV